MIENPFYSRSLVGRIFRAPAAGAFIVSASLAIKSERGEWRKTRAVPLGASLDYTGGRTFVAVRNGKRAAPSSIWPEGVNENRE